MIMLIALTALAVAAVIGTIVVTARDGYGRLPSHDTHAYDAASGRSPYPPATQISHLG